MLYLSLNISPMPLMILNTIVFVRLQGWGGREGGRENKYLPGMIISPSDENHLSRVYLYLNVGKQVHHSTGRVLCSCR